MLLTHMPFEDIPDSSYSMLQWVMFQLQNLLSGEKLSEANNLVESKEISTLKLRVLERNSVFGALFMGQQGESHV